MDVGLFRKIANQSTVFVKTITGDVRGNVSLMTGLAAIPMVIAGGMALDYLRIFNEKAELQVALDSAAIAGVAADVDTDGERETAALSFLSTNYPSMAQNPAVTFSGAELSITASTSINAGLMGVIGHGSLDATATAVATRDQGSPVCMLSLDPTGASAIEMQGSASVSATDCAVHSNSNHPDGLNSHTSTPAQADAFCVVGGYKSTSYSSTPVTGCRSVDDPFANITWPAFSGCDETDLQIKTETRTLNPGTYCGGLDIRVHANATLTPGIYVIKDGPLSVTTDSTLQAAGVSFVLMGTNTSVYLQSGTTVNLTAMDTGDFAGIAIAQNPASNPGGESDIQGGSNMNIVGSIYMPTQKLDLGGGGDLNISAAHTALVAYQIDVRGDTLTVSLDGSLFPGADNVPVTNETVRLIE